jgi:hypothetical protein
MSRSGEKEIAQALDAWARSLQERCQSATAEITSRLEEWAKAEHAYTDRTGALTASITGEIVEIGETLVRGTLSAGTTAAVFLELAHQGKWAFLWPVIERHKVDIAAVLERHLSGTGRED